MMADFNCVPVLDVSTDNSREAWPAILLAIQSSTFTAIDMVSRIVSGFDSSHFFRVCVCVCRGCSCEMYRVLLV